MYRLKTPSRQVALVLGALAEGLDISAAERVFGVRHATITRWLLPNGVEQLLERIKEQAGIQGVRVSAHTFRHTFARMFLEQGGDVYKLSRLMGHTDVKTTEKYRKRVHQPGSEKTAGSILAIGKFRSDEARTPQAQRVKTASVVAGPVQLPAVQD